MTAGLGLFGSLRALLAGGEGVSIAARLAFIALVAVAGLGLSGLWLNSWAQDRITERLAEERLGYVVNQLIAGADPIAPASLMVTRPPADPAFSQHGSGFAWQIYALPDTGPPVGVDAALALLGRDLGLRPADLVGLIAPIEEPSRVRALTDREGRSLITVSRVSNVPGAEGRFLFVASVEPRAIDPSGGQAAALAMLVLVAICALAMALVTAVQVRIGLAPLARLKRDVAALRQGRTERLAPDYPPELAPLTGELNTLIDHNREVVERARRHVGDLAHGLKTPITVLKNAAKIHQGPMAELVDNNVGAMERAIERHLARARLAAREAAKAGAKAASMHYRTPVLAELEILRDMMERKFDLTRPVAIEIEAPDGDLCFRGEREDLLDMVGNLIDNACKYGGGMVWVTLQRAGQQELELVVEDDGPGLSDADMAAAQARGVRMDEGKSGHGLGLSIVPDLADLYDGTLGFARSEHGGLKASLRLPATD